MTAKWRPKSCSYSLGLVKRWEAISIRKEPLKISDVIFDMCFKKTDFLHSITMSNIDMINTQLAKNMLKLSTKISFCYSSTNREIEMADIARHDFHVSTDMNFSKQVLCSLLWSESTLGWPGVCYKYLISASLSVSILISSNFEYFSRRSDDACIFLYAYLRLSCSSDAKSPIVSSNYSL